VWFKNRRAKCRQQQKAAEQVSKTTPHAHHQQRPGSAGSTSNTSAIHLPVGTAGDGDGEAVTSTAAVSVDDVSDDRLLYRHHTGGLLVASSTGGRPSCGWVPASLPPLLRQSSDTFAAGPYRVAPRLHSGPGCYSSAAAAAMFASRSGGYPGGPPYGSASELGGYGAAGWNVSVTQEAYCHRAGAAGGESCGQFLEAAGSTSISTAVPLFVASAYDHGHHHHHHIQHYHQHQQQQVQDDDLDEMFGLSYLLVAS